MITASEQWAPEKPAMSSFAFFQTLTPLLAHALAESIVSSLLEAEGRLKTEKSCSKNKLIQVAAGLQLVNGSYPEPVHSGNNLCGKAGCIQRLGTCL